MQIRYTDEVADAINRKLPVVALESTVIAHGLPHPENVGTALKCETVIREQGAMPATIAMFDGVFHVGLHHDQMEHLATDHDIRKISRRDLPIAIAKKLTCATTVATTAFIAHRAGIKVFATGGIGGVHRGDIPDVSADLPELAQTPITVVCAGAKIVLDLPATREWLETNGITVLGWQCHEVPAFYSRSSGLAVDERVENEIDVAAIARARDEIALPGAILVTVPVPVGYEIDRNELESMIAGAMRQASQDGISGKNVTPYLLAQLSEKSHGQTLAANIALLENNARIAALISKELA